MGKVALARAQTHAPVHAILPILRASSATELVRGGAGLLAEEAGEVRRIGERERIGDLMNGLCRKYELAFGFGQGPLADQMAGGDAGGAANMIVEAGDRHGQRLGIERKVSLLVEVLLQKLA